METQVLVVAESLETLYPTLSEKLAIFKDRLNVSILALEDESLTVAEGLDVITITDAIEADELGERLKLAVEFGDRASTFFEPWRELFFGPYQAVLDRKKGVVGVVEKSLKAAKVKLLDWERKETERLTLKAAAEAEQLARDEEARKLALAVDAEAAGMSEQAMSAILDAPSTAPTPIAQQVARPAGVSARKNWQAEVVSLADLVKAAAADPKLLVFLEANQSKLNHEAKTYESALAIPGVRAVNRGSLAVRRS